jgi:hypothetical protein
MRPALFHPTRHQNAAPENGANQSKTRNRKLPAAERAKERTHCRCHKSILKSTGWVVGFAAPYWDYDFAPEGMM